ncbi:hypothetical protein DH2020_031944 [Rehmannia glutinosa]|uniref:Uncharacterized protein n=1 Tax=Rehmannia glutinosa TaxID=99300 RepID=A0ABR0VJH3_REHGL
MMMLKNMLEDKKLNLNQPILSVRRYSHKADKTKTDNTLPAILRRPLYSSDPKSSPVTNPGSVPFHWEQIPGQPKEHMKPQTRKCDGPSPDENIRDFCKETTEESKSCDEAFIDALDTLSRIESFLFYTSMSCDDLDAKVSGSFSTDSQTRENLPEKQSVVRQQPRLKMKIVNRKKPGGLQNRPSFAKRYFHYHHSKEKEGGSDKDCDQHENLISNCGLRPRFCLKSSVCLVNPVPVMSLRTRVITSPANGKQSKSSPVDKIQTAELKENKNSSKINEKDIFGAPEETKHAGIKGSGSRWKGFKTFQELLADEVFEKTVYVDTGRKSNCMRSSYPNEQDTGEEYNETNTKRMDEMHVTDTFLDDFKNLNVANKSGDDHFNIVSSPIDKSNGKGEMEILKSFGENQDSTTTENIQEAEKEATKNVEKQLPRSITLGSSHKKYSETLVPPPLPKSPSDSWLSRTLPSIHSFRGEAKYPQNHVSRAPSRQY